MVAVAVYSQSVRGGIVAYQALSFRSAAICTLAFALCTPSAGSPSFYSYIN